MVPSLPVAVFLPVETTLFDRGMSMLGIPALMLIAWLLSVNRRRIDWRPVAWGVVLQLVFAVVVLSPALSGFFFTVVDSGVKRLIGFSEDGASFVFGTIAGHQVLNLDGSPLPVPFGVSPPVKTFAFWILPTIVFFSSLMSILYHIGVMQKAVYAVAWVMQRTMRTSGAESLATAANIFVGQTEAPLVVKPFVATMTRSELHAVMTAGFATVAGGVMAAYVGFLKDIPGIAGHLVTASIMSAPAAIAISKIMVPEDGVPVTLGSLQMDVPKTARNVIQAAADGAAEGVKLAVNVAGMLIAFVGLMAMANFALGLVPFPGEAPLSIERVLGWVFMPVAFVMGVPWGEAQVVGTLFGQKLVLTEFVAYINLGAAVSSPTPVLSERSAIIASYGLCGFANFASIGIQLGGIGGLAPERMGDLAELGLRAMIAGSLAAFMTGTIAGVLIG